MTLQEIKTALDNNIRVFYTTFIYEVYKDNDNYFFEQSGRKISIIWCDGTLNGDERDFYTLEMLYNS